MAAPPKYQSLLLLSDCECFGMGSRDVCVDEDHMPDRPSYSPRQLSSEYGWDKAAGLLASGKWATGLDWLRHNNRCWRCWLSFGCLSHDTLWDFFSIIVDNKADFRWFKDYFLCIAILEIPYIIGHDWLCYLKPVFDWSCDPWELHLGSKSHQMYCGHGSKNNHNSK